MHALLCIVSTKPIIVDKVVYYIKFCFKTSKKMYSLKRFSYIFALFNNMKLSIILTALFFKLKSQKLAKITFKVIWNRKKFFHFRKNKLNFEL